MIKDMDEQRVRQIMQEELSKFLLSDKFLFSMKMQIMDGRNIQVGKTTGTIIGTETSQKIGLYGVTPVVQGATITDPSGQTNDLDSEARTAINALIDRLQDIGIIA